MLWKSRPVTRVFVLMYNGLVHRTQTDVPYHRLLPTQHHCALPPISSSRRLCVFFPCVTVMVSLTLISVAPKGTILETVVTNFQCILFIWDTIKKMSIKMYPPSVLQNYGLSYR